VKNSGNSTLALKVRDLVQSCIDEGVSGAGLMRCKKVGKREVYVGSNVEKELVALFPPLRSGSHMSVNSVEFEGKLEVRWEDAGFASATMSMLKFSGSSSEDIEVFSHVVSSVIRGTNDADNGESYAEIIEAWLEMVNRSQEVTMAEIIGLWGELIVLGVSNDLATALDSWQWSNSQPIDFLYRGSGLEVKTNLGDLRRHSTSLQQFEMAEQVHAIYGSVNTFLDPDGASVIDLMNELVSKLETDSMRCAKVVSAVARRVGFGLKARGTRFNENVARTSLRFYQLSEVPAPFFPSGVISAEWTFEFQEGGCSVLDMRPEFSIVADWLAAS
jgi:Putative  PD-(D/E)XK family member, (DUF4420)